MSRRSLTILQLNDLHGYVEPHPEVFRSSGRNVYSRCGGLARVAGVFRQAREEHPGGVLALDNGDTLHGTYLAVQSRGEALLPMLNLLAFDAMTAHWEFAYGPQHFRELAQRLSYPVLAINCYDKDSGSLVFAPTRVVERAGVRIGIVGIASNIVDKGMPPDYSTGVCFTLGNEELPGHIERLRSHDKVELVVVLSHLGFPQDLKLAAEVPGIDVLISGHTHNRLDRPARVGDTVLIQSGCHGSFVGRLDLTLERGKVVGVKHRLIVTDDSVVPDPEMAALVAETVDPHRALLDEVVGRIDGALDRAFVLETSMDNVLLDAIASVADTRLAFSNGWRYGAPVLPGDVTLEHLWNMVPTNPPVSTLEMTGDELRAMLERNLERTFSNDPYCQMGGFVKRCRGLNLYFKMENPAGQRIEDLIVEGRPVVGDRVYRAAMLGVQGVPMRYGSRRETLPLTAVEALQRQFRRSGYSVGGPRHSVVAV